mmetsp:Transcript_139543/g.446524  ORF Transcript_139543/g.446524 Transcript_139543/m.446524 type:complete len:223 (+) Transcript_139543:2574-3242(+)
MPPHPLPGRHSFVSSRRMATSRLRGNEQALGVRHGVAALDAQGEEIAGTAAPKGVLIGVSRTPTSPHLGAEPERESVFHVVGVRRIHSEGLIRERCHPPDLALGPQLAGGQDPGRVFALPVADEVAQERRDLLVAAPEGEVQDGAAHMVLLHGVRLGFEQGVDDTQRRPGDGDVQEARLRAVPDEGRDRGVVVFPNGLQQRGGLATAVQVGALGGEQRDEAA